MTSRVQGYAVIQFPCQVARTIYNSFTSLSGIFQRAQETLPGPTVRLWSPWFKKEDQLLNLLSPLVEDLQKGLLLSHTSWSREEIASLRDLLDRMLTSPSSLRTLAYRDQDRIYYFLKGAMRRFDPEPLERKMQRLTRNWQEADPVEPEDRLTAADCGALEYAAKWALLLEALQELGVNRFDSLIAQWKRIALLAASPLIQELEQQSYKILLQHPVALFLAGKKEWIEGKLHSDLKTMSLSDMLRYICSGDGTHIGFFVQTKEGELKVSHQITSHLLHAPTKFLGGLSTSFCMGISIAPLLSTREREEELQSYFESALQEAALTPRTLEMPNKCRWIFSMIFGPKTLFAEDAALPKQAFCTTFTAKLLLEAWEKTNAESLRLTGHPLQPLFSSYDATSRMTIAQLINHLKSLKVIARPEATPFLTQCLNLDSLTRYWEELD